MRKIKRYTEEEIAIVREHYATMINREISEQFGMSIIRVQGIVMKFGFRRSPEVAAKHRGDTLRKARCTYSQRADIRAKRTATMRRTRRKEIERLLIGEPQRTKLALCVLPMRTRLALSRLSTRYGYIRDGDINSYTLYYDELTNRAIAENIKDYHRKPEEFYTKKFGIRFEPAESEIKQE